TDKQQSLTLKNGKKILQEIDEIATAEMTLSYRLSGEIDMTALPVSSLNGKIKIAPDAGGAKVTWTARYYRAFTGNEPPAGQDDESAKTAIDSFVKAGLNGLKDNKSTQKVTTDKLAKNASCCMAVKNFLKRLG
ncbi:MAG TPA: SRPBCC family protein, partial [Acinetobacter johnsonii]|nr:SRPBCC family protein [Acinetobacter johnsonii]